MLQAFFPEFLEKNFAGTSTPDRGRFRSFLLTAFKQRKRGQKRGGGHVPISIDFQTAIRAIRSNHRQSSHPEAGELTGYVDYFHILDENDERRQAVGSSMV